MTDTREDFCACPNVSGPSGVAKAYSSVCPIPGHQAAAMARHSDAYPAQPNQPSRRETKRLRKRTERHLRLLQGGKEAS